MWGFRVRPGAAAAWRCLLRVCYLARWRATPQNLYTLNTTTGVATAGPLMSSIGIGCCTINGLVFNGSTLHAMRDQRELITINTTTGAITPNVPQSVSMSAIAFD